MKPMRLKHLIFTMSYESRMLRKESYRHQRRLREMVCRQRMAAGGLTELQIARILKKARGKRVMVRVDAAKVGLKREWGWVKKETFPDSLNLGRCGFERVDPSSPKQEWIDEKVALIQHFHRQRTVTLRDALRSAQLAYAFLRNKSYADAENLGPETNELRVTNTFPNWGNIQYFVRAFSPDDFQAAPELQRWIEDAKAYRTKHGRRNEKVVKEDEKGQAQDADDATVAAG